VIEDLLTKQVIGAAIEVHRHLGPGLLESSYQKCLQYELEKRGLIARREIPVAIQYKDLLVENGYRIDLLINEELVIETKVVEELNDIHLAQILTYLKFGGFKRGLLLNFKVLKMIDGIQRVSL